MNSGRLQLSPFDVMETYSPTTDIDVPTNLGQYATTPDGRTFRFGFNDTASTTLAACKNTQGPAVVANHQGIAVTAASIGAMSITVTLGGTAATADQYANGLISIISGTGSPTTYSIKGNPAQTDTTGTLVLSLNEPVRVAISGTVTANLWANPYSAVIICPTTITGTITGVNQVAIAAQYYGWFQVGGLGTYLNDANTSAGLGLKPSSNTAGALMSVDATGQQVAVADQAGVTTAYQLCRFTMA